MQTTTTRSLLAALTCTTFLSVVSCSSGGGSGVGDGADTKVTVRIEDSHVDEDSGSLSFVVRLSEPSSQAVSVDYATVGITATVGTDLVDALGTLLFAPGIAELTITVDLIEDQLNELEETFEIHLHNPSAGLELARFSSATGTIRNDDPEPMLDIADASVLENNDSAVMAHFVVSLSEPSGTEIEVAFRTINGVATAGTDYVGAIGTVTFAPGETSQTITVTVLGDTLEEADETFSVVLEDPTRAGLNDSEADGMILDDDEGTSDPESGLDDRPENEFCTLLERPLSTGFTFAEDFTGLSIKITALFQAPGDNSRWYATHRLGRIRSFANDTDTVDSELFIDLQDRVIEVDDGGLLGLAFHPDYATNREAFVFYTGAGSASEISSYLSRFRSLDGGVTLDPTTEEILFEVPQEDFHKGGTMRFGTDGYLYVSVGDAGDASNSADLSNLAGKMLRIDVDSAVPYGIPADNPFAAGGGRPEIWAYGLRNPWMWSFDRVTGEIWLGDVGKDSREEVNFIEKGKNYGWPSREGTLCHRPLTCFDAGFTDPVVEYTHTVGRAVIGGFVYRGALLPELFGVYLYGDWSTGVVWALRFDDDGNPAPEVVLETGQNIRSFTEDQDGELLFVGKDRVFRIVPSGSTNTNAFPTLLSDLPCVDPADPSQPLPGMIPYDVNVPFWSNNAIKDRWFALPDDETVNVTTGGNWEFPIGAVFLKNFRLEGQLVETRLLVRHADGGWAGYTYEWNEAETDATLLSGGKTKTLHGQEWSYPDRGECLGCHTDSTGRVLGFRPEQLNLDHTYDTTGRTANQLVTFEHVGIFNATLGVPPENQEALPDPTDPSVDLDDRARAYLDANCANCHNPGNAIDTQLDLRYNTPLSEMGICNVNPTAGDLGVPDAKLLTPGNTTTSVLSLRIHVLGDDAMPPLGKTVVDADGAALIDAWILSLVGCP